MACDATVRGTNFGSWSMGWSTVILDSTQIEVEVEANNDKSLITHGWEALANKFIRYYVLANQRDQNTKLFFKVEHVLRPGPFTIRLTAMVVQSLAHYEYVVITPP